MKFRFDKKSGKSPVIPIVQVIHERKLVLHDEIAWSIVTNLIHTAKFLATLDDEFTPLISMLMRVLSIRSLHARPPIDMRGNVSAHMSGGGEAKKGAHPPLSRHFSQF